MSLILGPIKSLLNNKKENTELEVRFGKYFGRTFHSITVSQYDRVIEYLSDKNIIKVNYIDHKWSNGLRRRFSDKEEWEIKNNIYRYDNYKYDIVISLSEEIPAKSIEEPAETIRTINRTSYIINEVTRIDLSKVEFNGSIQYELEAEHIGKVDRNSLLLFETGVIECFKIVHFTEHLYNKDVLKSLIKDVNLIMSNGDVNNESRYIDSALFKNGRNLRLDDIVLGGVVENTNGSYIVSNKADGVRKLIVFHETGIWFVFSGEYNLYSKEITEHTGTILEGEYIKNSDPKYLFYIYDVISVKGSYLNKSLYTKRLSLIESIINSIPKRNNLDLRIIPYTRLTGIDNFFTQMNEALDKLKNTDYKTDGLMFTPNFTPYNTWLTLRDQMPTLEERILTKYPDMCKWKPSSHLTIDFRVRIESDGQMIFLSRGPEGDVPFTGTQLNPINKPMIEGVFLSSGSIHEFLVTPEETTLLKYVRPRYDKKNPNSVEIANDIWDLAFHPVSESTLRGLDDTLLQKCIQTKINDIVSRIPKNSKILDIGGHSRSYNPIHWKNHKNVVIAGTNKLNSFKVIPLNKAIEYGPYDVITSFLSLESYKNLDEITNIIDKSPGSNFIFISISSKSILSLFGDKDNIDLEQMNIKKEENTLTFNIPNSTVPIRTVYIPNIKYPSEQLIPCGILNNSEKELIKLYSYGNNYSDIKMSLQPRIIRPSLQKREENTSTRTIRRPVSRPVKFCTMVSKRTEIPKLDIEQFDQFKWFVEPTIGDGSCCIHSALQAVSERYRDADNKGEIADMIRVGMIYDLNKKTRINQPFKTSVPKWATVNGGMFLSLTMQNINAVQSALIARVIDNVSPYNKGEDDLRMIDFGSSSSYRARTGMPNELFVDYSLPGLEDLLNSRAYIGDELTQLIADYFNVNIVMVDCTAGRNRINHLTTRWETRDRDLIFIMYVPGHYQTMGAYIEDNIQFCFPPGHPIHTAFMPSDYDLGHGEIKWMSGMGMERPKYETRSLEIDGVQDLSEAIINKVPKTGRVGFVSDDDSAYEELSSIEGFSLVNYVSHFAILLHLRELIFERSPFYYNIIRHILITTGALDFDDNRQPPEEDFEFTEALWPSSPKEFLGADILLCIIFVFNMKQDTLASEIKKDGSIGQVILNTYYGYISQEEY